MVADSPTLPRSVVRLVLASAAAAILTGWDWPWTIVRARCTARVLLVGGTGQVKNVDLGGGIYVRVGDPSTQIPDACFSLVRATADTECLPLGGTQNHLLVEVVSVDKVSVESRPAMLRIHQVDLRRYWDPRETRTQVEVLPAAISYRPSVGDAIGLDCYYMEASYLPETSTGWICHPANGPVSW